LFSKKNRLDAEEKFSIDAVSKEYINLFSKLVND
jgi:hypothetical protein